LKYYKNIKSLQAYFGVASKHPLLAIHRFNAETLKKAVRSEPAACDFYQISFVQNATDFIVTEEGQDIGGVFFFTAPSQKHVCSSNVAWQGFQVLIHTDIYRSHLVDKNISAYTCFARDSNDPLLLNQQEAETARMLCQQAYEQLHTQADKFTIPMVLSYISLLLNHCQRISDRQLNPQHIQHNQLANDFIKQLNLYYAHKDRPDTQPSVAYFAELLHVTPNHLSDVVRKYKGVSALQIIHDYMIEEAKLLLQSSNQSVAEISYHLGFAYPSYFSRLFKQKTQLSPSEFRQSVKQL